MKNLMIKSIASVGIIVAAVFTFASMASATTIPPTGNLTESIAAGAPVCNSATQTCTVPWTVSAVGSSEDVIVYAVLYAPHPVQATCETSPFTVGPSPTHGWAGGGCITYLTPNALNDGSTVNGGGSSSFTQSGVPCGTTIDVGVDLFTASNGFPPNSAAQGYPFYDLSGSTTTPTCPVTPTATASSQTVCDAIVGTQTDNVTVTVTDVPAGVTGDGTLVSFSPSQAHPSSVPTTIGGNGSFLTGLTNIPGNATSASLFIHIAWSNGTSNDVTATTTLPGNCVIATPPTTPPKTPVVSTPVTNAPLTAAAIVTATAAPAQSAPVLAMTGANIKPLLLAGSGLILLGLTFLGWSKWLRRRIRVRGVRDLLGLGR